MWAIALVTLRRFQEPAFGVLLIIGGLVAYASSGVGAMDLGFMSTGASGAEDAPQGMMVGALVVGVLGGLVGVFTGATEIPRDVSSRMVALLLSKPISRADYFLGKYLGCLMMACLFTFLWLLLMLMARGMSSAADPISLGAVLIQGRCLLMLIPIVAIAVAISTYLADIAAMVVTCGLVFVCFAIALVPLIVPLAPPAIGKILLVGYFFVPNMGFFLAGPMNVAGEISLFVYSVSTASLFLWLGHTRIEKGDIF